MVEGHKWAADHRMRSTDKRYIFMFIGPCIIVIVEE